MNEWRKVWNFIERYDFTGALEILQTLEQRLDNVGRVRNLIFFVNALSSLDKFSYKNAHENLLKVKSDNEISNKHLKKLIDATNILIDKKNQLYDVYMLINFFFTGMRYAKNGKYDLAVFMMYRISERYSEIRLKEIGIKAGEIKEKEISDVQFEKYKNFKREIFGKRYREKDDIYKPNKVGFIESFILLFSMDHKCFRKKKEIEYLKKVKELSELRNKSIYAHGTAPLDKNDYEKFYKFSEELFKKYLYEKIKIDYKELNKLFMYSWLRNEA